MNKHVRIAKELVRLAKSLMASDEYVLTYGEDGDEEQKSFDSMDEVEKFVKEDIEDRIRTNEFCDGILIDGGAPFKNIEEWVDYACEKVIKSLRENGKYDDKGEDYVPARYILNK